MIASKKEALLQPGIDWTSFEEMIKGARKIKIIGGEPTVAPDMFKLLDKAVQSGDASHIELSFYTNITNMQDKWLEQLAQFERVIVNCSLEGMGQMNDYLRPPSKWDSVWKHFDKLVKFANTKAGKRIKVRVTPESKQCATYCRLLALFARLSNDKRTWYRYEYQSTYRTTLLQHGTQSPMAKTRTRTTNTSLPR